MRELEFGDDFWREALSALRGPGGVAALPEGRAGYAELVEELVAVASEEAAVVCGRPATTGKNPRLFLFLTSAFMAREGVRTLYLDLSPDVRWLEQLTGMELKEGIIDHLQYDVSIERCVHASELPNLSVLSGGAYFLTGSPLDDPPGFRAALGRVRKRYEAVVLALAPPTETAESTGVPAICDAVLTIEEGDGAAELIGCERAVIRLTGSPQAAWDLARFSRAFFGPLPAILSGGPADGDREPGSAVEVPVSPASPDPEGLEALRAFQGPSGSRRPGGAPAGEGAGEDGAAEPQGVPAGLGSRARWTIGAVALVGILIAGLAWSLGRERGDLAGPGVEATGDARPGTESLALAVRLPDPDSVAAAAPREEGSADERGEEPAAEEDPEPAPAIPSTAEVVPWSVHVGSYQNRESGQRVVERIGAFGLTAFLTPVNLPGKGVWQRVYVGAFHDSTAARSALRRLLGSGVVEEGVVRRTPLAYHIGSHSDREAAERERRDLSAREVPAYVLGSDPATVYVGAFQSEVEADLLARALGRAGVPASLAPRHRSR